MSALLPDVPDEAIGYQYERLSILPNALRCHNPKTGGVYLLCREEDGTDVCSCPAWRHSPVTHPATCKHLDEARRRDLFSPALVDYDPALKPVYELRDGRLVTVEAFLPCAPTG